MSEHLHEREVASQTVFEGGFLKVRRDRARLPDGSEHQREYVVHPGAAAMVPIFPDGTVLVERQFRYPLRQVFVEIPAGKLDAGEAPIVTAQRELLEETGYAAAQWAHLTRIHPAIGFADEKIDIFLCRELTLTARELDHGEHLDLEIVTVDWLVGEILAGRLTDVKTQIAVLWLDRMRAGLWPWPAFRSADAF